MDKFQNQSWQPLVLLNVYRLILSGALFIAALSGAGAVSAAGRSATLLLTVSTAYVLLSLLWTLTLRQRRPAFSVQLFLQLLVDVAAITLLVYAADGVRSGLGLLLVASLAGGGILMSARLAVLFAAIAALAVLGVESWLWLKTDHAADYTHAGLLGTMYFAAAYLAHVLARRARESEALAAQRGVDLANMQQLTEYIIQRMQTGIVVVDAEGNVRLVNESAWHLLGGEGRSIPQTLASLSPALEERLHLWQRSRDDEPCFFRHDPAGPEIMPRFASIGPAGSLIFLEDTAATAQQAQQLKLASLGRLTASIAHEIRNPLGAISHAGQLLAESTGLAADDQRLTEIICDHSQRMNAIIENILQLSRRSRARPEDFALRPWLERFVADFCVAQGIGTATIALDIDPPHAEVRMDATQLHQIVWNLCSNGLRYSPADAAGPRLVLRGGQSGEHPNPFLDVLDRGPGVPEDDVEHLFEPFFTTGSGGTGLGLYIARELCEANQARLAYLPVPGGGSCFRITFADPRRRQVA